MKSQIPKEAGVGFFTSLCAIFKILCVPSLAGSCENLNQAVLRYVEDFPSSNWPSQALQYLDSFGGEWYDSRITILGFCKECRLPLEVNRVPFKIKDFALAHRSRDGKPSLCGAPLPAIGSRRDW
ncbi:MAG TPA: hypothetical protein VF472_16840 [Burkholderiaceae bacterium]